MEQQQLDVFRSSLLSLKLEIEQLQLTSDEASGTVVLDQSKVGRLSRMDAMQAQEIARETARRRKIQLQKINSALQRLDAGEYGFCLVCDEPISIARLEFDPASTRCMQCMEE